ncbi:IPT/TIG domain-containing protein [Flavobacterium algicola]|uniref:IPT/TIG domain-containing protein n=1 Tax=Flavobacterium algicola TaxID=556529 RepID=UPI001EFD0FC8|nr:IPT/TIG domain-containing protein [Flavobacterium algicola]MCG9793411.1 IPT/TIG domain-containing protein [Flavobacterium algicola]
MNIIVKISRHFLAFLIVCLVLTSCDNDDNSGAAAIVEGVYSLDNTTTPPTENKDKGYPGDLVKIEGSGLAGVKSVLFDDLVNVIFNPQLSADKSLFFNIPFDDKKGSRFGVQELKITKGNGEVIVSSFEILQPKVIISEKFEPSVPEVGTIVTVNGVWFFNISSVKFAGEAVSFTRINSTSLTFMVPETATAGGDVEITTPGGTTKRFLDIDQGFDLYKIADFDGGGLRPSNNWVKYGDANSLTYSAIGGISGNYAEFTWTGASANGYNGSQSDAGNALLKETVTDATKAFYLIDVNCGGAVGTKIDLLLVDSDGGNWAYSYTIATTGWQTIEAKTSDFGANYDSSQQGQGDVNPSKINQVKMTIAQNGGTANPSKVQFDNIRFKVLR